jgi:hypothetical protein
MNWKQVSPFTKLHLSLTYHVYLLTFFVVSYSLIY